MSLNKVMLIGNVGKDPEIRYLDGNNPSAGSNTKVATFPLATSERYRDRNGELHENTEWHNVVAWRGNADVIERFVKRGTQLYVEGRLRTRSWTDQNGAKKFTTEVVADTLQLLGKKSDNQAQASEPAAQPYAPAAQYQQPAPQAGNIPMDAPSDDLPF